MKNKSLLAVVSFLLVLFFVYMSFQLLLPSATLSEDVPQTEFSTERALKHLEIISEKPHYIGSDAHTEVKDYLLTQLELLGLEDVHIQEGFTLNPKWGVLAKPKNIVGKIKGVNTGKALLLLAHYDSAPHSSSHGASDAGSGVVAILEGVRAYLASGNIPQNDIIILFSDAEEIGLMGAKLFVEEHPWAANTGLVINFEARGSGGPSNMIVETNEGNAQLIKEFINAKPDYPVATSLMYSIYKMLPNDTDSTVFREEGDIDSFFFAFIDDHYDYHTANDTYENLDRNTLEHQGTYVMAMLNHFSNIDLNNLKADEDHVYFNFPVIKMVSYPFSWVMPMLIFAIILFLALVVIGLAKRQLSIKNIFKGFLPLLIALALSGVVTYFGWKGFSALYTHYGEILHGFTYNGHLYIKGFVFVTVAICFWIYGLFTTRENKADLLVAPIFVWLLVSGFLAVSLKGGAYFIIPVYFALLSLWLMMRTKQTPILLLSLLTVPAIFIFAPLIQFFPVGLGLKMLVGSALLTVLTFGLLLSVIVNYNAKRILSVLALVTGVVFFITAHNKSDFTEGREKPNSLVYYHNTAEDQVYWLTYDTILDDWTKTYLGEAPQEAGALIASAASKYGTGFTYAAEAPLLPVPTIDWQLTRDTIIDENREVTLVLYPQRKLNRMTISTEPETQFEEISFNGVSKPLKNSDGTVAIKRQSRSLADYYVSDNDSLVIQYRVEKGTNVMFTIQEISLDLLSNTLFDVPQRPSSMIPKPFITNDAIIIKQTIDIPEYQIEEEPEADDEN